MLRRVFLLFGFVAAAGLSGVTARAQTIESPAAHVILLDDTTGVVLFEKNADEQMAPASMSKLMTCACTETSRALTGSSQTMSFGFREIARATLMR